MSCLPVFVLSKFTFRNFICAHVACWGMPSKRKQKWKGLVFFYKRTALISVVLLLYYQLEQQNISLSNNMQHPQNRFFVTSTLKWPGQTHIYNIDNPKRLCMSVECTEIIPVGVHTCYINLSHREQSRSVYEYKPGRCYTKSRQVFQKDSRNWL